MKYKDALVLKEKHKNLIGTTNEKGLKIDALLILPGDASLRIRYLKAYIMNGEGMSYAFLPDDEVVLWAIDLFHLRRDGLLFYYPINE